MTHIHRSPAGAVPDLPGESVADRHRALEAICRKTAWNVLPLLLIGYVMNTLNKLNVGFAALEMNKALGFTPAIFGFGAGLFFLTYTLAEVPSNLLLQRFGPRRWLARILITWGLISAAAAYTYSETSFYVFRLVLGLAEAGWFPGVLFFLAIWFPPAYRARAIMLFFLGSPVAAIIGAPLSGALLSLPTIAGVANWQWLFIVEGIPTVILGFVVLARLKDNPAQATWLNEREKSLLISSLSTPTGKAAIAAEGPDATRRFILQVAFFAFCNFGNALCLYGTFIWIPQIIKGFGALSNFEVGLLTAVPFIFSAIALVIFGMSSDRLNERRWHVVGLFALAAVGFAAAGASRSPAMTLSMITLSKMGLIGAQGAFFALISETLRRSLRSTKALAVGLGLVTGIGNLGGFAGPYVIGLLVGTYGNFYDALYMLAAVAAVMSLTVLACRQTFLARAVDGRAQVAPAYVAE